MAEPEIYEIKRIEFMGKDGMPILLQTKNGPCPLLAVANVLLLSGKLELPQGQAEISLDVLTQAIAEKM